MNLFLDMMHFLILIVSYRESLPLRKLSLPINENHVKRNHDVKYTSAAFLLLFCCFVYLQFQVFWNNIVDNKIIAATTNPRAKGSRTTSEESDRTAKLCRICGCR